MTSRATPGAWMPLAALVTGLATALLIALLVLGRDTEVFPTYLVYTADPQPLPRAGLVQLPDGTEVVLRFELIPHGNLADDIERLDRRLAQAHVAGLVLDRKTYEALPREQVRDWRHAGIVLVTYGVDALQVVSTLELEQAAPARGSSNTFVLIGPADQTRIVGYPSRIDHSHPFLGIIYLPPRSEGYEGVQFGWVGYLEADDANVRLFLTRWADASRIAYTSP